MAHPRNSILGPDEFVDYEELPPYSSHELAAIGTDLNNIAWMRSGLDSLSAKAPDNTTSHRVSQGAAMQMNFSAHIMENDNYHFEEDQNKWMGMQPDMLLSQMHLPVLLPAEVEGLS